MRRPAYPLVALGRYNLSSVYQGAADELVVAKEFVSTNHPQAKGIAERTNLSYFLANQQHNQDELLLQAVAV